MSRVLIALLLLFGGCHKFTDSYQFKDCVATDLYIYESSPVGKRRVYDCSNLEVENGHE